MNSTWATAGSISFGAHTAGEHGDWYNRNAIGICLVGDGDRREFTPAQIARLLQTVHALQRRSDPGPERDPPQRCGPHHEPGQALPGCSVPRTTDPRPAINKDCGIVDCRVIQIRLSTAVVG